MTAEAGKVMEKPGWELTFHDEFDRPVLNDMYWYAAYRSGRKDSFRRLGIPSRWHDHNAHYVFEDGVLKLRIAENMPYRPDKSQPCVSCLTTSDHRFGADGKNYQVMEKFAQKHGWFEIRCRVPRGEGLLSAFWLHQSDPTKQEYTPEGRRRDLSAGPVEIDIIEQQGRYMNDRESKIDLNIHFTEKGHFLRPVPMDLSADFHIYAVDWQEGRIDWYMDGERLESYRGPTPPEKMFILVALFQYSGWIGNIDPDMPYPRDLEIDYIRAYRRLADNR